MENKTLILIVTFNRLNDLKICIESLKCQTYKNFDILVVNNGSSDGTKEWLDCQTDIISIHQPNTGGAGGFYTGMKYMYDNGYGWLLMMDDDGIPDKDELKNLIENYDEAKSLNSGKDCIVNALVVNKDVPEELAFNWGVNSSRSLLTKDYPSDYIFDGIHPFNGTLIKRSIIEKNGFIKKEMFIWGDEEEYMARTKANGFGTMTICSAIHRHPKEKGVKGYLLPWSKKLYVLVKPQKMSHIFYRNKGYIYSHFDEKRHLLWKFFICHFFYNFTHFRFAELCKLVTYYRKGKNGDFNV